MPRAASHREYRMVCTRLCRSQRQDDSVLGKLRHKEVTLRPVLSSLSPGPVFFSCLTPHCREATVGYCKVSKCVIPGTDVVRAESESANESGKWSRVLFAVQSAKSRWTLGEGTKGEPFTKYPLDSIFAMTRERTVARKVPLSALDCCPAELS